MKFSYLLFNGKILKEESLKKMKKMNGQFALGLFDIPFYNKNGFGHTGGIDGFSSVFSAFTPILRSSVISAVTLSDSFRAIKATSLITVGPEASGAIAARVGTVSDISFIEASIPMREPVPVTERALSDLTTLAPIFSTMSTNRVSP